jgi:hypothetical protein
MRVIALAMNMATGAHLQLKGINMSVIGKMNLQSEKTFDKGQKVTLGVVCENAFMAHYHPENENVVFTRYSPSGQAEMHFDLPMEWPTKTVTHEDRSWEVSGEFYLIYVRQAERPNTDGALFFSALRCASRTEYGSDLKTIELCNPYGSYNAKLAPNEPRLINIKLGIDNPAAADQFEPGTDGWWVVGYSANDVTMDEALALVHRF